MPIGAGSIGGERPALHERLQPRDGLRVQTGAQRVPVELHAAVRSIGAEHVVQ